ncbi:MAG: hypothetical protein HZC55_00610 [Verrucomicrobia bacterium]|nr:hypothetical protein [Verrucomicrobiota bacterium]
MLSRSLPIIAAALAVGFSGLRPVAWAQVAARSPFLPPTGASAAAPTVGAALEFRAYVDLGDGMQFRLHDPARKSGVWVRLNERNAEFDVVARQHDELQKTLTVEHQGKTLTLAMREPKVVSAGNAGAMPAPPPVPAPVPTPNVLPAVTQSVVLNPTAADEQRRLEAVAAEVARRRALREQATLQVGQGTPASPSPVVVPPVVSPKQAR